MKKTTTFVALLLLSVFAGYAQGTKQLKTPSAKALQFTENKGQVTDQHLQSRSDIDFKLSAGNGLNVFIGKGKLAYQWAQKLSGPSANGNMQEVSIDDKEEQDTYVLYRMDVELVGANTQAKVSKEGLQSSYERYFQPWINISNSNNGISAAQYSKLTYCDVYPHIDWVFYFNNEGQLEHDFVIKPGGNVRDIKIKYSGAQGLQINADGSFSATTSLGSIKEHAPIACEQTGKPVPVSFVLDKDVVSFATTAYKGTLIIDPVVEWGTYFGGLADDAGLDITTDKWGHVYLCGSTSSVANIATTGAHQNTYATGTKDAFVSKWDEAGALLWASYYGGAAEDVAKGIACDTLGNVYFGGNSNSQTGIATVGSAQAVKGGNPAQNRHDAFLVKMDSAGVRQWATYLGGNNQDAQLSFDLTVDQENKVYITGNTLSTDLATTSGAHQMTKSGTATTNDAFISKYNSDGTVVWTTYFGGTSHDYANGMATGANGTLYLAGYTLSANGIATAGAHQALHAGAEDAFLVAFDNAGQQLWGTYLGGSGIDRSYTMAANNNYLAIAGLTTSDAGINTSGAHQLQRGGGDDAFLALFNVSGQLQFSTYYGGASTDYARGLHLSNLNDIYLSGQTQSDTGIASMDGINNTSIGLSDIFLAKFNVQGARYWATYMGGSDIEYDGYLGADYNHNLYLTGSTNSANGISTTNAHQPQLNGSLDGLLCKINDCPIPPMPNSIIGNLSVCAGTLQQYVVPNDTGVASYIWLLPPGWTGASDSTSIDLIPSGNSGVLQVVAISACGGVSDTQSIALTVLPLPTPIIVNNNFILSTTQSFTSYQWMLNGVAIPTATNPIHVATEDGDYTVRVTGNNACVGLSPSLIISGTVGVDEKQGQGAIAVYPNPTADKVYIQLREQAQAILSSIDGSIIIAYRMKVGTNELDLRPYSPGSYLLKVSSSQGQQVFKIVKQ